MADHKLTKRVGSQSTAAGSQPALNLLRHILQWVVQDSRVLLRHVFYLSFQSKELRDGSNNTNMVKSNESLMIADGVSSLFAPKNGIHRCVGAIGPW